MGMKVTMNIIIMESKMSNPFSVVKNTRMSWSKYLQENIKEDQVQFADEEPSWIPYTTLLAIQKYQNNM